MKYLLFCIAFVLMFSLSGYSQKQLVLVKKNKVITRISEGELIRFRRKGQEHFTKGYITGIQQESFRINEDTTYLYNIAAIDLRGRPNANFKVRQSGIMLIMAGSALVLINVINSQDLNPGIAAVSGAFIATGIFMQFVNNDIYKISHRRKVISMKY
ncbi:MAG: hypothetical protein JJE09_05970 [Bacteroidia bacterium]|nr:hypothetical protein [Bacteroidia bacterium]